MYLQGLVHFGYNGTSRVAKGFYAKRMWGCELHDIRTGVKVPINVTSS